MAFGAEHMLPRTEALPAGRVRGGMREAAVECWFTAGGRAMPLMMKVQDDEQRIWKISDIRVVRREKRSYAGIPAWEYRCRAPAGEREEEFLLLFYPEECRWKVLGLGNLRHISEGAGARAGNPRGMEGGHL